MSLWVAGTDTGVGKSVVSACILRRHADRGPIAYWKPVSTGGDADRDRTRLAAWLGDRPEIEVLPESYHFELPASPHLAARVVGTSIDPERILQDLVTHGLADPDRNLLIEAAGGLMVPLTDDGRMLVDVIVETALPVVLVARSTLGTINHTLLSIEALRRRRLEIAGVVLNGPRHAENRRAIARFGKVAILGEIPPLVENWSGFQCAESGLGVTEIAAAAEDFDPEGVLGVYL